jgi:RNA polymerase primary sigma factor
MYQIGGEMHTFETPASDRRETSTADDTLHLYLRDIARHPSLTPFAEIELSKRIAAGDRVARQRMIESNLRLVVTIARSFQGRGLDLLDLIQEGTLGLVSAVDRYDWRRGTRFSTYGSWWIRHEIMRALAENGRTIRLPESMLERLAAVRRAEAALSARNGRAPSTAEIAAECELAVKQVLDVLAAAQQVTSLDAPLGDDGELCRADAVADEHAADPIASLAGEDSSRDLAARLESLSGRRRLVLELRYGLRDGLARSTEAVAAELGVTRQRVRQLELTAIRTLSAQVERSLREAA